MHGYRDDILELRKQFALINHNDPADIQKWFAEHPYLSTNEHAQVAGRCTKWIRDRKRMAGIKRHQPKTIHKPRSTRKIIHIDVPPDWDNPEWLQAALLKYPIQRIAVAIGLSGKSVRNRIKKWGLRKPEIDYNKPKNPLCNKAWVYEHYVVQELTQAQCAKLAGICVQSFANWLNRFGIQVRKPGKKNLVWQNRLIHQLEHVEIVNRVYVRSDHIHVRFRNYYWETYFYGDNIGKHSITRSYIINESQQLKKIPSIKSEYESDLDNPDGYPAHVMISSREWNKANFIERRLAIHQFAWLLNRRGWIPPNYPERVIHEDWQKLVSAKQSPYIRNDVFIAHPLRGPRVSTFGFKTILHHFGLDEMAKDFTSPKLIIEALNIASEKVGTRINLGLLIRIMSGIERTRKMRVYDPGVYRSIFRQLGITGTIYDLHPCHGQMAMACALAGLRYTTNITPEFQKALDAGFADFIGLDFEPYHGQKVDCVTNIRDFAVTPIQDAMAVASKTKRIIQFVSFRHKNAFAKKFPTAKSLKLQGRMNPAPLDYLFIL